MAVDIIAEKVAILNNKQSSIIDAEIEQLLTEKNLNFRTIEDKIEAYTSTDYVIVATPADYTPKNQLL